MNISDNFCVYQRLSRICLITEHGRAKQEGIHRIDQAERQIEDRCRQRMQHMRLPGMLSNGDLHVSA